MHEVSLLYLRIRRYRSTSAHTNRFKSGNEKGVLQYLHITASTPVFTVFFALQYGQITSLVSIFLVNEFNLYIFSLGDNLVLQNTHSFNELLNRATFTPLQLLHI